MPIPGDPGFYIAGLDVFHQLHCLASSHYSNLGLWLIRSYAQNMLRKRLWTASKSLADEDEDEIEHVEHCIESARQYMMCTADISPIVWTWNTRTNTSRPVAEIYHTCRDFDALHRWSKEHALESFDPYVYVENDL